MANLVVGNEVVRVDGGPGSKGNRGKVVELDETKGRVRVYWHTEANGSPEKSPKRTWVKYKCVQVIFDTVAVVTDYQIDAEANRKFFAEQALLARIDSVVKNASPTQIKYITDCIAANEEFAGTSKTEQDAYILELANETNETTEPETITVQETSMNATIEAPVTTSSKANRFTVYGLAVTAVLRAMGKAGDFSSKGAFAALECLGASGMSMTTVRIQLLAGKNGQRGEPAQLSKKQLAELTKLAKAADKAE